MRIIGGWRAVRGPTRVRNAGSATQVFRFRLRCKIGNACCADEAMQAPIDDGDAARIVTAVLEPPDAFDQDGDHIFASNRADDSAHACYSFAFFRGRW